MPSQSNKKSGEFNKSSLYKSYVLIFTVISLLITLFLGIYISLFTRWGSDQNTRAQLLTVPSVIVKTTLTSAWTPASPDPSGIAYWPQTGNLIVSDGEVDEMGIFQGVNIFEITRSGTVINMSVTTAYSKEPTGIAINTSNNHIFISDDDKKMVFEILPGADNKLNTADDIRTSFSTLNFGSDDPEGLAFGNGELYIADGSGSEIYKISPGINKIFDGVAPTGDDIVTHFDTTVAGETDPEGIEYNPDTKTLFVAGHGNKTKVAEFSTDGKVLKLIDITALGAKNPSGLAYGPSSDDPSKKSLYIVDRAVDNNTNPNENDGKLYEIRISTATVSANPTPTTQLTATPVAGQVLQLTPILDTHVRSDWPANNYTSNPDLKIDGTPISIVYLKFDTSPVVGKQIMSAKLKLYVIKDQSKATQTIKTVNSLAVTNNMTYNTKPVSGTVIGSLISHPLNTWVEVDITADLSRRIASQISYSIDQSSSDGAFYGSSESATKPVLIISYR